MQQAMLMNSYSEDNSAFFKTTQQLTGPLAGKRVLDIGCDYLGNLLRELVLNHGVIEAVGANPGHEPYAYNSQVRIECIDAADTGYPDGHFDLILSSSAFEHVSNLGPVLTEAYRILKPGGYLYTSFGPIWSGKFGHHLWTVADNKLWNYHNVPLPPFCHLLMTQNELLNYCRNTLRLADSVAREVVTYVFTSPEQNQLMYEDYIELFENSPFEVLFYHGLIETQLTSDYMARLEKSTMHELHRRYPGRRGFMYDNMDTLLYKPRSTPATITLQTGQTGAAVTETESVTAPEPNLLDFERSPAPPPVSKQIEFDSQMRYHMVYPVLPGLAPDWHQTLNKFLRQFRLDDRIGLILLDMTEGAETEVFNAWLESSDLSAANLPDLHLLHARDYEPDELLGIVHEKANLLLLSSLSLELLQVPLIHSLVAHYKPVLLLRPVYDSQLALMKVPSNNLLRAFPLFKLIDQRLPGSALLQLNYRYIAAREQLARTDNK